MIIICHNCASRYKVRDDIVSQGPKKAGCKNCGVPMLIVHPANGEPLTEEVLTLAVNPENAAPDKFGVSSQPSANGNESPSDQDSGETGEGPEADNSGANAENAMAKLEKRRREMEDEIAGRLHKAALETLEYHDLDFLGNKLKNIESNPDNRFEEEVQFFACIKCKDVFALYPEDPRQCPNCMGETPLIRGQDILRQFGMFNR